MEFYAVEHKNTETFSDTSKNKHVLISIKYSSTVNDCFQIYFFFGFDFRFTWNCCSPLHVTDALPRDLCDWWYFCLWSTILFETIQDSFLDYFSFIDIEMCPIRLPDLVPLHIWVINSVSVNIKFNKIRAYLECVEPGTVLRSKSP